MLFGFVLYDWVLVVWFDVMGEVLLMWWCLGDGFMD